MFDKVLLGVYKDGLYLKQNVRDSKMFYNYHIFDISDGCSFIAERITDKSRPLGSGLYDIMSDDQVMETVAHATSYTEIPLFVNTTRGVAMMLPHLAPCSSLGVLIFPHFGGDHLFRIYKHMGWRAKFGIGTDGLSVRYSKNCTKYTPFAEELNDRIHSALDWTVSAFATDLCGDITPHLENRVYAMSYFTGCPVGLTCNESINVLGEFDFPMFTAFLLIMSAIVCDVSPTGECAIALSKPDHEVEIRADFITDDNDVRNHPSAAAIKRIVDRKRMCIVPFAADNMVHCKFYPTVKDWSILGIKSPDETDRSAGQERG